MNRAEIVSVHGEVDLERLERLRAKPQASPAAAVTVLQWNAALHRSHVLYHGPMKFSDVRRLGDRDGIVTDEGAAS